MARGIHSRWRATLPRRIWIHPHDERREEHGSGRAIELSSEAGDALITPIHPGFELPVARVFAH
jgi:hypothetical protein